MKEVEAAKAVQRSFCTTGYANEKPSCVSRRQEPHNNKSNTTATRELLGSKHRNQSSIKYETTRKNGRIVLVGKGKKYGNKRSIITTWRDESHHWWQVAWRITWAIGRLIDDALSIGDYIVERKSYIDSATRRWEPWRIEYSNTRLNSYCREGPSTP